MRGRVPGIDAGGGAVFGLSMFLLEDEILNPVAGLAAKPAEYPWQAHARGLVAHVAYGVALELALRAADRVRGFEQAPAGG